MNRVKNNKKLENMNLSLINKNTCLCKEEKEKDIQNDKKRKRKKRILNISLKRILSYMYVVEYNIV